MSKAEQDVINHLREKVLWCYVLKLYLFGFDETIVYRYEEDLEDLVEGVVAEYVTAEALLELYSGITNMADLFSDELDFILDEYVNARMIGWKEFATGYINDMEKLK